jgi:hypothetical protein
VIISSLRFRTLKLLICRFVALAFVVAADSVLFHFSVAVFGCSHFGPFLSRALVRLLLLLLLIRTATIEICKFAHSFEALEQEFGVPGPNSGSTAIERQPISSILAKKRTKKESESGHKKIMMRMKMKMMMIGGPCFSMSRAFICRNRYRPL